MQEGGDIPMTVTHLLRGYPELVPGTVIWGFKNMTFKIDGLPLTVTFRTAPCHLLARELHLSISLGSAGLQLKRKYWSSLEIWAYAFQELTTCSVEPSYLQQQKMLKQMRI